MKPANPTAFKPGDSPRRGALSLAAGVFAAVMPFLATGGQPAALRAGACAVDITPREFPVIVSGGFLEKTASRAHDRLHARCLALDDGSTRLAIVVVDSCVMPRELLDEAKRRAHRRTGIPPERILIAATHTHSAPSVMGCLGSSADKGYAAALPDLLARGIERAVKNLVSARVGWTVVEDYEHTNCRRWILRPDRMRADPFGNRTVRAHMHPGYQNPDFLGPGGPVDPALSLLAVQTPGGCPVALLANYSMHYFGAPAVSADYYGLFADKIARMIQAEATDPPFVAIMSQGTSGDLHWMDYSKPKKSVNRDSYAEALARLAFAAYGSIQFRTQAPLRMLETKLRLRRRVPDEQRLAWATKIMATCQGIKPRNLTEVYAREQLFLAEEPVRELKIQALRIGHLGIAAIPCEVFGITGLKIKAQSPLEHTVIMELANGEEGYIPPPSQHRLGGYTTWPARTAGLEINAEPKIVEAVLGLLEKVSGKNRRRPAVTHGPYAKAVLASKPIAYWRMEELSEGKAGDASGNGRHGAYESRIAYYLDGTPGPAFSGEKRTNRAPQFAGGRLRADLKGLGASWSLEMWFWNALPVDARLVTGYLFSRGSNEAAEAPGDHLGIGGTHRAAGNLIFFNGNKLNEVLCGTTPLKPKTWYHVVMVREGNRVRVYLNGNPTPEIAGETQVGYPAEIGEVFVGGRNDNFANFEGKIDEVAIYNRALGPPEISAHWAAARPR